MKLIKVTAHSRVAAVAGAIAGIIRDERGAEVQAIGAPAVNQMVKAIINARQYLQDEGSPPAANPVSSTWTLTMRSALRSGSA